MNDVHFQSNKHDWETPDYIVKWIEDDLKIKFTLDPCASLENRKAPHFITKEQDGLKHSWQNHTVFMNPPYGNEIQHWIKKAFEESGKGALVVALIPARPDTQYWHTYILNQMNVSVYFIKSRIRFLPSNTPAPFPSCFVIWRPMPKGSARAKRFYTKGIEIPYHSLGDETLV